jgi:hypothetical protein
MRMGGRRRRVVPFLSAPLLAQFRWTRGGGGSWRWVGAGGEMLSMEEAPLSARWVTGSCGSEGDLCREEKEREGLTGETACGRRLLLQRSLCLPATPV